MFTRSYLGPRRINYNVHLAIFAFNSVAFSGKMSYWHNKIFCKPCRLEETIGFYCATLIYKTILEALNAGEVYGEGVMAVTSEWFDVSEIRLTKQVSCSDGKFYSFWMIPTRFAYFKFENDPGSLSDEVVQEEEAETRKGLRLPNITSWRPLGCTTLRLMQLQYKLPAA